MQIFSVIHYFSSGRCNARNYSCLTDNPKYSQHRLPSQDPYFLFTIISFYDE